MPKIKALDVVPLLLTLGVIALFAAYAYGGGNADKQVRIRTFDSEFIYPLDKAADLLLEGPLGVTHVHIRDGAVWVSESPCKEKICIGVGKINRAGTWLACLPNRVFIQVEGKDEDEVDAAAF